MKMTNELIKNKSMQSNSSKKDEGGLEVFKTFIVRFMENIECSFYNVTKPQDGTKNTQFSYDDTSSNRDDKSQMSGKRVNELD